MKLTLSAALGLSLMLSSCSSLDPEYAAYKKQKEAGEAPDAYGAGADPYGVPGGGADGGETGSYAPLQPLPGDYSSVPAPEPISPLGAPTPGPTYPSIPYSPSPAPGLPTGLPTGATTPHLVVKGDTLWGLAKRYNTTEAAIRAANGMTGDTIQTGRTIQIPQR